MERKWELNSRFSSFGYTFPPLGVPAEGNPCHISKTPIPIAKDRRKFGWNRKKTYLCIHNLISNKNNNMVNVNFSKAKCPICGKKVSLRVISKYFWHGTSYYTECNHCGQRIHPAKEPVSMFKCFSWGGMSVLLPMYSYWNLVAWDFLPALLCAIPFILLTLLISCILIVRKIQFII